MAFCRQTWVKFQEAEKHPESKIFRIFFAPIVLTPRGTPKLRWFYVSRAFPYILKMDLGFSGFFLPAEVYGLFYVRLGYRRVGLNLGRRRKRRSALRPRKPRGEMCVIGRLPSKKSRESKIHFWSIRKRRSHIKPPQLRGTSRSYDDWCKKNPENPGF